MRAQIAELDARWHEQLTRQPRWLARLVIFAMSVQKAVFVAAIEKLFQTRFPCDFWLSAAKLAAAS
jgi:hypothetical protein